MRVMRRKALGTGPEARALRLKFDDRDDPIGGV